MTSQRSRILSILGLMALGVVAIAGGVRYVQAKSAAMASAPGTAKKQLYRCPMHPQVVQDHEGKCPICGMNLVLVEPTSKAVPPSCGVHAGGSGGCCGQAGPNPEPSK